MNLVGRMTGGPPLLWDGGIGTGLVARGLDLTREPPEAWLRRRPDDVQALHEDFAAAGCDVLQTNTFGLLRLWLAQPEQWSDVQTLVASAVALAAAAARTAAPSRPPHIVASLGPTGALSPDLGRVEDACATLAAHFAAAGVSALHLETSCAAGELQAALRGARAGAPDLPLLCSLTLSLGNSGLETPLGTPLASMLRAMDRETPDAVGLNCSQSGRRMGASVAALHRWTGGRMPILVQPQVDQTSPDCKRHTPPETDEQFVHGLLQLLEQGADAVGGCCGCGASHLRAARRALGDGLVRGDGAVVRAPDGVTFSLPR